MFLIVESLLFGFFVFAIICDQITSIYNNEKSRQISFYFAFKLVFQTSNPILWFLPCEFTLLNRNKNDKNNQQVQQHVHFTV